MNTCKDCKHWLSSNQEYALRGVPEDQRTPSAFGSCQRWATGYHINPDVDLKLNEVLVESDEGWAMMCDPDFGCVLWEAKS